MDDMKVYNRAFISTCIAISIPFFVWGNTISHLPWIASKINMSHSTIGYFFMIFAIINLLTSQVVGRYIAPVIGSRNTLTIGAIIFSPSPYFFGFSNSVPFFLLSAIPCGIGIGFLWSTATAVTNLIEDKTNRILQTYLSAFFSLGFLFGGLCSGVIQRYQFDTYNLFSLLIIIAIISPIFVFYLGLSKSKDNIQKTEKFSIPEKDILIYGLYLFIFFGSIGAISDWSPLWFKNELLTSSTLASLTIVAWGSGETIGKFLGSSLIKKTNERIIGGYLSFFGCSIYLIIVFFGDPYLILIGLFLIGFCSANFVPVLFRLGLKNTKENVNTTSANISTIGFFGFLVVPALIGYSAEINSIGFNVKLISVVWLVNFIFFLYTTRVNLSQAIKNT